MTHIKTSLSSLLLLVTLGLAWAPVAAAEVDELFAQANRAYEEESYEQAKELYLQAIEGGTSSADLFYNLGNTFAKLDEPGRALLNYRRALLLDPYHQEAAFNSNFIKSGLAQIEPELSTIEEFFGIWPASAYMLILTMAGWLLLVLVLIGLLSRFSTLIVSVGVLALLSLVLGISGFVVTRPLEPGAQSAMITGKAAKAHYAPALTSSTVTPLPEGTAVKILNDVSDWTYVELPDKRLGWVKNDKLERLLPEFARSKPSSDNPE